MGLVLPILADARVTPTVLDASGARSCRGRPHAAARMHGLLPFMVAACVTLAIAPAARGASHARTPRAKSGARQPAVTVSSANGSLRFSGEVQGGERFERTVLAGLTFALVPTDAQTPGKSDGWAISLFAADTLQDMIGIATPPYHGVNEDVILAWHFRNADNTGPNQGDVNAPQDKRGFYFVTNPRDYAAYSRALDIVLWPTGQAQGAIDSAQAVLDRVPRGEGLLTIREMKLGGLGRGLMPWFEWMRFDVELTPPLLMRGTPGR